MPKIFKCRIINSIRCPRKSKNGKGLIWKSFNEGQIVTGERYNHASMPGNYAPVLRTTQGYIIPEDSINIIGEANNKPMQEVEIIKETIDKKPADSPVYNTRPLTILDNVKKNSKYTVNGAIAGVIIGLLYAMIKGKNKMVFAGIGALGGGFIGSKYNGLKNDK